MYNQPQLNLFFCMKTICFHFLQITCPIDWTFGLMGIHILNGIYLKIVIHHNETADFKLKNDLN